MKVRTPHVRARLVGRIPSKHVARYKNMAFGCLGGAYIVNGMMLKVVVGQARWICSNRPFPWMQAPVMRKVETVCAWEADVRWREKQKSTGVFCGLASVTSSFRPPPRKTPPFPLSTSETVLVRQIYLTLWFRLWHGIHGRALILLWACPSQLLVSSFSGQGLVITASA
jgi:hypothetical protein